MAPNLTIRRHSCFLGIGRRTQDIRGKSVKAHLRGCRVSTPGAILEKNDAFALSFHAKKLDRESSFLLFKQID